MELHRIKLTKKKLAAMPEDERTLLLLLGHANNEINVLSKLILMVRKDDPPNEIVNHVEAGQIFVIMRLLIGKLHEAWELFKKRFQGNRKLAAKYAPQFGPEAAGALEELNRRFGSSSPLTAIRNKIAFHYTDKDNLTEANFQRLPDTEPLEFYMTRTVGNSFYLAAELIISLSAINLARKETGEPRTVVTMSPEAQAFNDLCNEVIFVSRHITELFGSLMGLIVETIPDLEIMVEELPDGPKLSAFSLPYFFDEDDALSGPG